MLVITLRVGEVLTVGDNVAVTFVQGTGTEARFGIEVPEDVLVQREEIYLRFKDEGHRQPDAGRVSAEVIAAQIDTVLSVAAEQLVQLAFANVPCDRVEALVEAQLDIMKEYALETVRSLIQEPKDPGWPPATPNDPAV